MRILQSALLASLAPVVHSQLSSLPTCALSCAVQAIGATGCSSSDITCWCQTQRSAFSNSFTPCLLSACPASDISSVNTVLTNVCAGSSSGLASAGSSAIASASTSVAVVTSATPAPHTSLVSTTPVAATTAATTSAGEPGTSSSAPRNTPTTSPSATAITAYIPSTTASPTQTTTGASSTSAPDAGSGGLSTGAKAGIGIAAALVAIIAIIGIWFCLRQRQKTERDPEIPTARGHEMPTSANNIEIDGKNVANATIAEKKEHLNDHTAELGALVPGIDGVHEKGDSRTMGGMEKATLPSEMGTGNEKVILGKDVTTVSELQAQGQSDVHEMPALVTATIVGSDWEHPHPAELASDAAVHHARMDDGTVELPATALPPSTTHALTEPATASSATAEPASSREGGDRLEILRQRIERVREDKERLEKIQQLKELEKELQDEIMADRAGI